jgi:hypothetical protein
MTRVPPALITSHPRNPWGPMARSRGRHLCALAACVLAASAVGMFGAAQASARTHVSGQVAWCSSHQLVASAATGRHAVLASAGGTTSWFVELRNNGASACEAGGQLTLSGAHTVSGARVKLTASYGVVGIGGSTPRAFVLRRHQDAFVQVQNPAIRTAAESKTCKLRVLLTFTLPHSRGKVSVRAPREAGLLCPGLSVGVLPTSSAATFHHFIQGFNTSPSGVPYDHRSTKSTARGNDATTTATVPPPVCDPSDLILAPSTSVSSAGTAVTVAVTTNGPACLLIGGAPTIELAGAGMTPVVAKI